jgi:hypothetical protein
MRFDSEAVRGYHMSDTERAVTRWRADDPSTCCPVYPTRPETRGHPVRRALCTAVAIATAMTTANGCGEAVRAGRAPVVLVIDRLEGASGSDAAKFSTVLHSDVETLVARGVAGTETSVPTVFGDVGQAALHIALKDVGQPGNPAAPTDNNAVTITRYRVAYRRTDGRNVPGIDVPYAFEGAATVTIGGNAPTVIPLELVRVQAKQEPPLRSLRGGGGALAISAIADVTFYGRDLVGHEVSAAGALSIVFADWADPQ